MARPHRRLNDRGTKPFPSSNPEYHAHFKKDQGNRKAARHPLAMLLHVPLENEHQGDSSGSHPKKSVDHGRDCEGARSSHSFFKVLDIKAERGGDENPRDVKAPDHAMELAEPLAQTVRKLYRPEQKGASAHNAMRQQLPLKGLNVRPFRIRCINQETFVMPQNIKNHQTDETKEQKFRAQLGVALERHKGGRHSKFLFKTGFSDHATSALRLPVKGPWTGY